MYLNWNRTEVGVLALVFPVRPKCDVFEGTGSAIYDLAGWRIYVTNTSQRRLDLIDAVQCYRQEWQPEHAFHRLKGGVLAMTRELGVQFARDGIRVNALCPGPVNTPLLKELFAKDPERAQRRLVHVPVGRFGEPEEIANAVLFLASDESSFITASTFLVDGGISGAYVTPL
jgi:NAD(P)-dependent dehydrogenase (short-subunit alcohol dehydrogenase family)